MQTDNQQGVRKAGRFRWFLSLLICGFIALFTLWLFHSSYTAVRDGYITDRLGTKVRSVNPASFWLSVAIRTHLGLFFIGLAVWALTADTKPKARASQAGAGRRMFHVRFVVRRPLENRVSLHFGECTICGQGQLLPVKQVDTGELLVMCDDCESQWHSPDEAHSSKYALREDVRVVDAAMDEVAAAGWDCHPRAHGQD